MRLAILGSTRGTNLDAIVSAIKQQRIDANIVNVISNKKDALILQRAQSFGLPYELIESRAITREDFDELISKRLVACDVDLIVLIGYMRILSATFVSRWENKIINVHPSLLPHFAGLMDLDVHRAVLAAKHKTTGCTVHYVTAEVDNGPILVQKRCAVLTEDTAEILKARVQALEGEALVEAIITCQKNMS